MAKTSYVEIPAGSEDIFLKSLKSGDRFLFSKIIRNDTLLSRRRKAGISARSNLPVVAALWAGFSGATKTLWNNAAAEIGRSGWQLFVQDQNIRIKNDMAGTATPSTLHQSWVAKLVVSNPASEIKLKQIHPRQYYIFKKVVGKKGMYEPILVTENFGLPLTIGINYKSDLTSAGANPFAKFYAKIWNSYQGKDDEQTLEINMALSHDWENLTATLSSIRGIIIGYELFIHLHDVTGSLWCDNIKATHNGQNWVRDPYTVDIAQVFTKQFQQIPKHWAAEILPDGAEYDSVYEDF